MSLYCETQAAANPPLPEDAVPELTVHSTVRAGEGNIAKDMECFFNAP